MTASLSIRVIRSSLVDWWSMKKECRHARHSSKFATGVVDTGGQPWAENISANFRKNSKRPYWYTEGLGGNWFMKKTRSKKTRDTVPLKFFSPVGRLCRKNWHSICRAGDGIDENMPPLFLPVHGRPNRRTCCIHPITRHINGQIELTQKMKWNANKTWNKKQLEQ